MLPPQLNLGHAEHRLRDPGVRVLASQVVLDSALVESFNRALLSGRSLVFSYPAVHTQQSTVPTGVAEHNVTVARAFTKPMGAFVTFWDNDAGSKIHLLANPSSRRCSWAACSGTSTSSQHRHRPCGPPATASSRFPTERVPKMPLSGVSTRSGDLARFTFKRRYDDGRVHPPDSLPAGDALRHGDVGAGLAGLRSSIGRGVAALKLGGRGLDSTLSRAMCAPTFNPAIPGEVFLPRPETDLPKTNIPETDLSASHPVSASPGIVFSPGPRRIFWRDGS